MVEIPERELLDATRQPQPELSPDPESRAMVPMSPPVPPPVQQRNGLGGAIGRAQGLTPNFETVARLDSRALNARCILIDRYHFRIEQNVLRGLRHASDVVTREERRGHDAPHAHLGAVLLSSAAA